MVLGGILLLVFPVGLWSLKDRQVNFGKILIMTLVLVGLALLGTFPPFFEMFKAFRG